MDTHDTHQPGHDVTQLALEELLQLWQDWSLQDTDRRALARAQEIGNTAAARILATALDRQPVADPLIALAANNELVALLAGWQWHAIRDARAHGATWDDIAIATRNAPERARARFLEHIERSERFDSAADMRPYRAALDDQDGGAH